MAHEAAFTGSLWDDLPADEQLRGQRPPVPAPRQERTPRVHDPVKDTAFANSAPVQERWDLVYQQVWPNVRWEKLAPYHRLRAQGVTCLVHLPTGAAVRTLHRVDRKTTGRFFLETVSRAERKEPGWMAERQGCDFLLYMFINERRCYVLRYPPLWATWQQHRARWEASYSVKPVRNKQWVTHGVCVPVTVFLDALDARDWQCVSWS